MTSKLSKSSQPNLLLQEMLYAVNKVNYNQSNQINALAGMGKLLYSYLFLYHFLQIEMIINNDINNIYSFNVSFSNWRNIFIKNWMDFNTSSKWIISMTNFIYTSSFFQAIFKNSKGVKSVNLSTPISRVVSTPVSTSPSTNSTTPRYKYTLYGEDGKELGQYDAVIMTAPMNPIHPIEWNLDGEILDASSYTTNYQITHATFVKGSLRKEYFLNNQASNSNDNNNNNNSGILSNTMKSFFGIKYDNPNLLPSHIFLVDGADKKVL